MGRRLYEAMWRRIDSPFFPLYAGGSMIAFLVIMCASSCVRDANTPIEMKRYTLEYQGQELKCLVTFPKFNEGKSEYWTGTVNLYNCADGTEYLGATNIKVLKRPEYGNN
jgi:hypothetical protein